MHKVGWVAAMCLLLACLAPSAPAQQGLALNVVSAADLGCSPDNFTSPDLRVTVWFDGQVALQTAKAQDKNDPVYAMLAGVASPASPVQVAIQVQEAEPGGFFGLGTTWVDCDTAAGSATMHTFAWSGETVTVVARGDADNAAEAVVVLGGGAPAVPTPSMSDIQYSSAVVSWDAVPGASHRVAWGSVGSVIADVPPGTSSHTLTGLCENRAYSVRVIRDLSPWHVASADFTFTAGNAPPAPPRILSAQAANGSITMTVELPVSDDIASVDVFGGATPDVAVDGAPVHANSTGPWYSTRTETFPSDAAYLRVRATDKGGLSAVSASFQVGGPRQYSGPSAACPQPPAPSAGPSPSQAAAAPSSTAASAPPSTTTAPPSSTAEPLDDADADEEDASEESDAQAPGRDAPSTVQRQDRGLPVDALTVSLAIVFVVLLGVVVGLLLRRR